MKQISSRLTAIPVPSLTRFVFGTILLYIQFGKPARRGDQTRASRHRRRANRQHGDLTVATLFRAIARHGITLPADQIADLCREFDVLELAVFGSFLREDFGPESDIDFLVVFKNDDLGPWMGKLQRLETRLSALLGREVDAVSKRAVEASENWIRRNHILGTAQVIYGS